MLCSKCKEENSRVIQTNRLKSGDIERIRKCSSCGNVWVTVEREKTDFVKKAEKLQENLTHV